MTNIPSHPNILSTSAASLLGHSAIRRVTERLRCSWAAAALGLMAVQFAPETAEAGTLTFDFSTGADGGFTTSGNPLWNFSGTAWRVSPINLARSQLISPVTTASGGAASVTFVHTFNFESGWDGGQVDSNINGGGMTFVPTASFTAGAYNRSTALIDPIAAIGNTNPTFSGNSGGRSPALLVSEACLPVILYRSNGFGGQMPPCSAEIRPGASPWSRSMALPSR